jgi:hypothetical protein
MSNYNPIDFRKSEIDRIKEEIPRKHLEIDSNIDIYTYKKYIIELLDPETRPKRGRRSDYVFYNNYKICDINNIERIVIHICALNEAKILVEYLQIIKDDNMIKDIKKSIINILNSDDIISDLLYEINKQYELYLNLFTSTYYLYYLNEKIYLYNIIIIEKKEKIIDLSNLKDIEEYIEYLKKLIYLLIYSRDAININLYSNLINSHYIDNYFNDLEQRPKIKKLLIIKLIFYILRECYEKIFYLIFKIKTIHTDEQYELLLDDCFSINKYINLLTKVKNYIIRYNPKLPLNSITSDKILDLSLFPLIKQDNILFYKYKDLNKETFFLKTIEDVNIIISELLKVLKILKLKKKCFTRYRRSYTSSINLTCDDYNENNTVEIFSKVKRCVEEKECNICFEKKENFVIFSCNHGICYDCFITYLILSNYECPQCRKCFNDVNDKDYDIYFDIRENGKYTKNRMILDNEANIPDYSKSPIAWTPEGNPYEWETKPNLGYRQNIHGNDIYENHQIGGKKIKKIKIIKKIKKYK